MPEPVTDNAEVRAEAEVDAAREHLRKVRERVAHGEDGASAVSLAEWRVHKARQRLDELTDDDDDTKETA